MFAKSELFESSIAGAVIRALGGVPIDRNGDPRHSLRAGSKALAEGRVVLIHPEGTRTRDGKPLPIRRGALALARETGLPIVPVRIEGGYEAFPSHAKLPSMIDWRRARRRRLKVIFGRPLDPKGFPEADGERALAEALAAGMFGTSRPAP